MSNSPSNNVNDQSLFVPHFWNGRQYTTLSSTPARPNTAQRDPVYGYRYGWIGNEPTKGTHVIFHLICEPHIMIRGLIVEFDANIYVCFMLNRHNGSNHVKCFINLNVTLQSSITYLDTA